MNRESQMTAPEIEHALFREEMAIDAFSYEPSPANQRLRDEARAVVDRAIREATS
jgi:hypothetical protein